MSNLVKSQGSLTRPFFRDFFDADNFLNTNWLAERTGYPAVNVDEKEIKYTSTKNCICILHILYFTGMLLSYWPLIVILFACMLFSVIFRKLTLAATLAGGVIACFIFIGAGYIGIVMLATFFILGSVA